MSSAHSADTDGSIRRGAAASASASGEAQTSSTRSKRSTPQAGSGPVKRKHEIDASQYQLLVQAAKRSREDEESWPQTKLEGDADSAAGAAESKGTDAVNSAAPGRPAPMLSVQDMTYQFYEQVCKREPWTHDSELSKVPLTFASTKEYTDAFFPLVLEEVAAACDQALEVNQSKTCSFLNWSMFADADAAKFGLHAIRFQLDTMPLVKSRHGDWERIADSTAVLVAENQNAVKLLGANTGFCAIMVMTSAGKAGVLHGCAGTVEWFKQRIMPEGPVTADCYLWPLANLVTSLREYIAAASLPYIQLAPDVLAATPHSKADDVFMIPEEFRRRQAAAFNASQLEAIREAASMKGFTLIQGPPGTGKTRTLVAALNTLLLSAHHTFYHVMLHGSVHATDESVPEVALSQAPTTVGGPILQLLTGKRDVSDFYVYNQALWRHKPRILVTAPSNAAVDAIIAHVIEGDLVDGTGAVFRPPIVRIGAGSTDEVRRAGLCLMDMADSLLNLQPAELASRLGVAEEHRRRLSEQIHHTCMQLVDSQFPPTADVCGAVLLPLLEQFDVVQADIKRLQTVNLIAGSRYRATEIDNIRRQVKSSFLEGAQIVFGTLSSAGLNVLDHVVEDTEIKFDIVIIDEAAQAVELSTLLPLRYGCTRCVLIGDPKQLPATVLSPLAARCQYSRSLFSRLVECGRRSHLLSVQYRSHPSISQFPSQYFYGGQVRDAENMLLLRAQPFHDLPAMRPFVFFDLLAGQESRSHSSYQNQAEVDLAFNMLRALNAWRGEDGAGNRIQVGHTWPVVSEFIRSRQFSGSIGIITPYRQQLLLMQNQFAEQFADAGYSSLRSQVEFNTIDGFQGREKDVIILSCVRAAGQSGLGFVTDKRRMNVALTRAKYAMWVIGHGPSLVGSPEWKALLNYASMTNKLLRIDSPFVDLYRI